MTKPTTPAADPSALIAQPQGEQALTAQQKKFNGLIRKIATERVLLSSWQQASAQYQQKRAGKFEPLLRTYRSLNLDLLHFLDQACDLKEIGKTDRNLLHELICDLAASLMHGEDHADVKAIFDRHSETDFDTEQRLAQEAMKSMVQQTLGVDLGDDMDLRSPEELMQRVQQQLDADEARAAEAQAQRRGRRKPSASDVRKQEEAQQASQSIREVYRKLVSALHPDREPDEAERQRKTGLMQRVNKAYAANHLLDLLQLQLEIEQIDPLSMHTMSDDRLRRYNQILADQLSELQQEVLGIENSLKSELRVAPYLRMAPTALLRKLQEQVQYLQQEIHDMQLQRQALNDIKNLKRWLRAQRT